MRLLTAKELAVFDAIVDQYTESETVTDIFIYDLKTGQRFLNKNNIDLEISIGEQWNILTQLAKEKFIKLDLMNEYGNNGEGDKIIKWVFGTDWAREFVQMSSAIEECYKKYGSKIFINLSVKDIGYIRRTFQPAYKTKLIPNYDHLKLDVICSDGYTYTLKAFNQSSTRPYTVFYHIYSKHPDSYIDNETLSEELENIAKDEYIPKIYEKNDTIKETLSSHIELKPESMRINVIAQQSVAQLERIKEEAIKITKTKAKK